MKLKLIFGALALVGAFFAGWQVNGWRLERHYQADELARAESVRIALEAHATYVDRVNREAQAREGELIAARQLDADFIAELQNEINERPVVRRDVRVPIQVDGTLECPAVPVIDWRVFQDLYNRAATGAETPDSAGLGDDRVLALADDREGSRGPLGD